MCGHRPVGLGVGSDLQFEGGGSKLLNTSGSKFSNKQGHRVNCE
jgi:hypothetical protein